MTNLTVKMAKNDQNGTKMTYFSIQLNGKMSEKKFVCFSKREICPVFKFSYTLGFLPEEKLVISEKPRILKFYDKIVNVIFMVIF